MRPILSEWDGEGADGEDDSEEEFVREASRDRIASIGEGSLDAKEPVLDDDDAGQRR